MGESLDSQNERHLDVLRKFVENNPSDILPILDALPVAICITDQYGKFKNVNQQYCKFYGYQREELVGKPFTLVVPESHRDQLQELHDQFMGKRYELRGKWDVMDRKGNLRKIISNAAYIPATETEGPQKMTFIVEVDHTGQILVNLQSTVDMLQNKISAQDTASYLSNHDLKNDLSSILQIADALLEKQPTEEQRVWLDHLRNRSRRTIEIMEASLDYAKMEEGNYQQQVEEFNVVQIIRQQLNELGQIIRKKAIQVQLSYQEKTVEVEKDEIVLEADKFYIERMLHNLLLNALEASPEKHKIRISIDRNGFFRITIHNRGAIPENIRAHFFEKFVTAGKKGGTGLGTYIAKLVVEMHEGSIAYHSSEDEGTEIAILLPRKILIDR